MPDKNGDFTLQELLTPTTLLAKLYAKKLPKYGWAGRKNATEKEYVRLWKSAQMPPQHFTTRKEGLVKDKRIVG